MDKSALILSPQCGCYLAFEHEPITGP